MVGTKLSSSLLPYVDPDPEGEGKIVAVNDDVDFTHHRFALHVVVSRVTIILTRVTTILTRVTIFDIYWHGLTWRRKRCRGERAAPRSLDGAPAGGC